jgi:hypothetical protein
VAGTVYKREGLTFSRHITASLRNGHRSAFETKPGTSFDSVVSFPHACAKARARSSVSDVVCRAGTSSTSFCRHTQLSLHEELGFTDHDGDGVEEVDTNNSSRTLRVFRTHTFRDSRCSNFSDAEK